MAGVANGLRNSLLYLADRKLGGWKRYRIPSHNNPYYRREDDLDNIKRFGGEESDDYQQLVAAKHGQASFTVITRDQIKQKTYPFYTYRYSSSDSQRGAAYEQVLERPKLEYVSLCVGIDCGFVDPTVITIIGLDTNGIWHIAARYVLQRIDTTMQEKIIDWLDDFYGFAKIGIDVGAGGGGASYVHSFLYRDEYRKKGYEDRIVAVSFGERVAVGFGTDNKELVQTTKTLGASILVERLQQHQLVVSEIDHAGISEIERITKQKGVSGDDRYFILSEKGNGASPNDHFFASLICWAIATRDLSFQKRRRRKLGKSGGKF